MKRTIILSLLVLALAAPAIAKDAKGVVYHDVNKNNVRDAGEEGIPGVLVSNGRDVVKTAEDGAYSVSVDEDTIIFVCKPRGWMVPLNDWNMPRFYYIHKPAGSPESKYPGVEPTGPLPESIDFALTKQEEPDRFRTIIFGDTQPRNQEEIDFIAHDVVAELINSEEAFGVTLGDIVFDNLDDMESLCQTIAKIGIPWFNVLGNHDMNYDSKDDAHSDETFERIYGAPYYAFQWGPVHFLVLDNVVWNGDGYSGGLGEEQLAFFGNYLAHVPEDVLVVPMMHIPIMDMAENEEFFGFIGNRPSFSMAAHWHQNHHFFLDGEHGWHSTEPHHHWVSVTVCGSWWAGAKDERGIPHATMQDGGPNGYSYLTFDGTDYGIEFKAAGRPADYQMNIYAPDAIAQGKLTETPLLVNVFAGSEKSVTEFRINDGEWTKMAWAPQPDPAYVERKKIEDPLPNSVGRDLPDPKAARHMWQAAFPADLPVGTHVITVKTTDMFGQTYESERVIRVIE